MTKTGRDPLLQAKVLRPASRRKLLNAALKGAFWGAGAAAVLAALVTGAMWAAASAAGATIPAATAAGRASMLTVMLSMGTLPLGAALGLAATTWRKRSTDGTRPRRDAPPG